MFSALLKSSTLLLGVAILLVGHGLQLALVPLRAEVMGWDSSFIGLLGSVYFGGFLAGCFVIPSLVGRIGHIRTFAALTSLMTFLVLGIALFDLEAVWLLFRFLLGIAIAGLYLVIESWLNENSTNQTRGGLLAAYTVIVLAGLVTGQLLLNVAPVNGTQLFIVAAMLIAVAAIPVCISRSEQPHVIPTARFSPRLLLKTSRVAALGTLIYGLVTGAYYSMGPAYGLQIGMDIPAISIMMALGIAGGAISQVPLGRVSDRTDRRRVILGVMIAGLLIAVIAIFLSTRFVPYLMFLYGACIMPIYALCLAHASDHARSQSFLVIGTGLQVTNSIGAIIGSFVAAQAIDWFGARAFFVFNGGVLTLGSVAVFYFIRARSALTDHYADFSLASSASAQGALQLDPRTDEADPASTAE